MFESIYALAPNAVKVDTEGLMMYGRMAATALAEGTSVLKNAWVCKDPVELEELEEWYCSIVDLYAPVGIAPRAPAPPPVLPVGFPRNEDGPRAVDDSKEAPAAKEIYQQKYTQTELAKLYRFCALEPLEMGDYTTPQKWGRPAN